MIYQKSLQKQDTGINEKKKTSSKYFDLIITILHLLNYLDLDEIDSQFFTMKVDLLKLYSVSYC